MKEAITEIHIDTVSQSADEFRSLLMEQIASAEGAAAMFILAMYIFTNDPVTGRECLDMCRLGEPLTDREIELHFTAMAREHSEIPRSYFVGALPSNGYSVPDGGLTLIFKVTNERGISRKRKTVYVGCSGTDSYRPVTLESKPPRYFHKRFGIKREYEEDPWLVTDFPSLLLPLKFKSTV